MNIKLILNRVLVRREKESEMTPGGIVIPESSAEKCNRGVVVSVGPGRVTDQGVFIPPFVKAGDKVVWRYDAGAVPIEDDKDLLIIYDEDILGIFTEEQIN